MHASFSMFSTFLLAVVVGACAPSGEDEEVSSSGDALMEASAASTLEEILRKPNALRGEHEIAQISGAQKWHLFLISNKGEAQRVVAAAEEGPLVYYDSSSGALAAAGGSLNAVRTACGDLGSGKLTWTDGDPQETSKPHPSSIDVDLTIRPRANVGTIFNALKSMIGSLRTASSKTKESSKLTSAVAEIGEKEKVAATSASVADEAAATSASLADDAQVAVHNATAKLDGEVTIAAKATHVTAKPVAFKIDKALLDNVQTIVKNGAAVTTGSAQVLAKLEKMPGKKVFCVKCFSSTVTTHSSAEMTWVGNVDESLVTTATEAGARVVSVVHPWTLEQNLAKPVFKRALAQTDHLMIVDGRTSHPLYDVMDGIDEIMTSVARLPPDGSLSADGIETAVYALLSSKRKVPLTIHNLDKVNKPQSNSVAIPVDEIKRKIRTIISKYNMEFKTSHTMDDLLIHIN